MLMVDFSETKHGDVLCVGQAIRNESRTTLAYDQSDDRLPEGELD